MGNVARPVMQASTAGCVWKRTGWQQSHSTSTCSAVLRGWAWGEASPRAGVGRHARLMTSFSCVYNKRGGRIRFGPHSPARIGGAEESTERSRPAAVWILWIQGSFIEKHSRAGLGKMQTCRRAVSVLSVGIILGVRIVYGTDFFRDAGRYRSSHRCRAGVGSQPPSRGVGGQRGARGRPKPSHHNIFARLAIFIACEATNTTTTTTTPNILRTQDRLPTPHLHHSGCGPS